MTSTDEWRVRSCREDVLVADTSSGTLKADRHGVWITRSQRVGSDARVVGRGLHRQVDGFDIPDAARRSPNLVVAPTGPVCLWTDGGFLYRARAGTGVQVVGPAGTTDVILAGPRGAVAVARGGRVLAAAPPAGRLRPLVRSLPDDAHLRFVQDGGALFGRRGHRGYLTDLLSGVQTPVPHLPIGEDLWEDPNDGEILRSDETCVVRPGPRRPSLSHANDLLFGVCGGVLDLRTGQLDRAPRLSGDFAGRVGKRWVWMDREGAGSVLGKRNRWPFRLPLHSGDRVVSLLHPGPSDVVARTAHGRHWRIDAQGCVQPALSPPRLSTPAPPWCASLGCRHSVEWNGTLTAWSDDGLVLQARLTPR